MGNPSKKQEDIDKQLMIEAERIIKKADEGDVILRLLGSIAFRLHCPKYRFYLDSLDRKLTDIDFASYSSERSKVEKLLEALGYITQSYVQLATATFGRSIYWKKNDKRIRVDVFWDKLRMNHEVTFVNRLHLEKPTIPLNELLQEKLQIVKLGMKDVKDTAILLLEHDIAEKNVGKEIIDLSHILEIVSKDWCRYYTFSENLKKIRNILHELETLPDKEKSIVNERIVKILNAFEKVPKKLSWKIRAKIGTKKKWYSDVE